MQKLLERVPRSLIIIAVLLLLIRLALPQAILYGINWALEHKGGKYIGHLDDFDLSLYRGAYQMQGLEIRKKGTSLPPLLTVKELDISLAWRGLLQRKFLIDAVVESASIRLIDSKEPDSRQFGTDEDSEVRNNFFDLLFPISIESVKAQNSAVYFTNSSFKKSLPIALEGISFRIQDLRTHSSILLSPFVLEAILQKHAKLMTKGRLDIKSQPFSLDIDVQMTQFNVPTINDILRIYIPLDITKGILDVYAEMALSKGSGKGYVNVFLKDMDIISSKQEFFSFKHFFYEIIAAVGNWFLENPKTNTLAFHMPIDIQSMKMNVDKSKIFDSVFQNRRGEFKRGLSNGIALEQIENTKAKEK